nr:hypothetical protein [uncultured Butyrivibrio sp.]
MEKRIDQATTNNNCGGSKRSTFIVKVDHCQNSSWQGRITWAEENKQVSFRSTLELLKLMNEAVEQTQMMGKAADSFSVS